MSAASVLYTTCPSREEGLLIARTLVEEHLVACANLWEGVTSVYRWEGEVQQDSEVVVLFKTKADLIDEATQRIRELHSYECPCVTAWPISGGNESYLDWIASETASPQE